MAYVKLPSVSDAMLTLMHTHLARLNGRSLRVSFSAKEAAAFDAQQSAVAPASAASSSGGPSHQVDEEGDVAFQQ